MAVASEALSWTWAAVRTVALFGAVAIGGLLAMPVVVDPALLFDAMGIRSSAPVAVPSGPNTPVWPIESPANWFGADDYPASARRAGQEGRVRVRLVIGPGGRVDRCAVLDSSGVEALDRVTCSLARRRGRFVPAGDAKGEATQAELTLPAIVWRMPDSETGPERVVVRSVDRDAGAK